MTRPVVFVWSQLGPTHADRLTAAAEALPGRRVVGAEIAAASGVYAWAPVSDGHAWTRVTLFPGRTLEAAPRWRRFARLARLLRRERPAAVFLCHYERPETWAAALLGRVLGARPVLMFDSTHADAPRRWWREAAKRPALWPYARVLASGERARAYAAKLGVPRERVALGYDSVCVARVRRLAGDAVHTPHSERSFVVAARFVAKKNLTAALQAYTRYRSDALAAGETPRELVLCGDGLEQPALDDEIARLGLGGVRFAGFLQDDDLMPVLARGLALLLPSTSEPWGLVVNEALALGVPPIVSNRAGAADLVRDGVSGHVVAPHDTAGMAAAMTRLAREPHRWAAMAEAARADAAAGDVDRFTDGVSACLPSGADPGR
ncbi:Glycosyltransferase involved in cell wall bisynthesis [Limimonas halophila]|uniref:Glycosyltransferase involved in cell wall bisynthesis n=1 Tax=Limimonas halophila TaxID=1082479 RepID=A0A1G7RXN8_9PROT|nr:glycosyltransferase [Limimonas halophila]SDG15537.1 Glycosyltransferase involved in cell wall bisynthesis [Limimonas halophila]